MDAVIHSMPLFRTTLKTLAFLFPTCVMGSTYPNPSFIFLLPSWTGVESFSPYRRATRKKRLSARCASINPAAYGVRVCFRVRVPPRRVTVYRPGTLSFLANILSTPSRPVILMECGQVLFFPSSLAWVGPAPSEPSVYFFADRGREFLLSFPVGPLSHCTAT